MRRGVSAAGGEIPPTYKSSAGSALKLLLKDHWPLRIPL